jgi:hypothetical protein
MIKEVEVPTVELVQKYNNRTVEEDVLSELFGKYSENRSLRDVLIKVSVLNSLYSTQIYAIVEMAKHIVEANIDDEIARVEINGKLRTNYSFATKYCHWHQPEMYPMYDSYVHQLLWSYHVHHAFRDFKQEDLRCYSRYKEIVESFRHRYKLEQFSLRELDKFLWKYGKECFGE